MLETNGKSLLFGFICKDRQTEREREREREETRSINTNIVILKKYIMNTSFYKHSQDR